LCGFNDDEGTVFIYPDFKFKPTVIYIQNIPLFFDVALKSKTLPTTLFTAMCELHRKVKYIVRRLSYKYPHYTEVCSCKPDKTKTNNSCVH